MSIGINNKLFIFLHLAHQAQLCIDATAKDLMRQADDLALLEKLKGKAYVAQLAHPTAYIKDLFNYFKRL